VTSDFTESRFVEIRREIEAKTLRQLQLLAGRWRIARQIELVAVKV
jgi:hypothetical protein